MDRSAPWRVTILTLFPEIFPGPLGCSLAGKARASGKWQLDIVPLREFGIGRHKAVDDTPFGGGAGMVMRADVIDAALQSIPEPILPPIYLTPRGKRLTQPDIEALAERPGLTILCGRYEGVDQRVLDAYRMEEISLGDFVLSGGEVAAMAMIEACVRLLPGAIGAADSLTEESFATGLLEYPHYTRPAEWRGRDVPPVLLTGHHAEVQRFRQQAAERVTQERRPDLWAAYPKNRGQNLDDAASKPAKNLGKRERNDI